jgi:HD-GYP domain-containing protein (c-di-GMP phosphodiesterase class II)
LKEKSAQELITIIQSIHKIQDIDALLEKVLHEARMFIKADAGTLYLIKKGRLFFRHIENDTLFKNGQGVNKHLYTNASIKIDKKSLAGYVASTGESLLIDNVYDIKSNISFAFNPKFDKKSQYKTISLLVVPLVSSKNEVIGVLQLINALNEKNGVIPFSMEDKIFLSYFAQYAADAIEKAELAHEMVLRMVEMAELHDPYETTIHAKRVGDYALELYEKWTLEHNIELSERIIKKDMFRIAAILHDVGKVGVNEELLQGDRSLSDEEKFELYKHTIYGARLFKNKTSGWDRIAHEVVLNHHERWDGRGYPGHIKDIYKEPVKFRRGKKGREIPLSARIVAIADVYDTLISERSYKEAWNHESAMMYIRSERGKQFDPELVDYFLSMENIIKSIIDKYKN